MKKIALFLIMSFLACTNLHAKKLFVEMEFHKNTIKLDDGSNKKRQPIKDKNGKNLKFTSLIGALNYMSLQGWELVDTKSMTHGDGDIKTDVYYIFCKEVSDEELEQIVRDSYKD